MNGSKWQSPTIGVAFALFIVWMERQGRWSLFAKAIGGQYAVAGSRNSGQGSQQGQNAGDTSGTPSTVSPSTPASVAPPNSSRGNAGVGSGQATVPSVGGGPPAPTFG